MPSPLQLPDQDIDRNFRPVPSRLSNWRAGKFSVPATPTAPLLFNFEIGGQVLVTFKNIGTFDVWAKEVNTSVVGNGYLIKPGEKEDFLVTEVVEIYFQADGGVSNVCFKAHGYRTQSL